LKHRVDAHYLGNRKAQFINKKQLEGQSSRRSNGMLHHGNNKFTGYRSSNKGSPDVLKFNAENNSKHS
jgi:hypothetical protein